jgi:DNA-directed RNA polymerase specialized sigma24 family protein
MRHGYGVPPYLPPLARPVVPWARRHVARVARRYHTSLHDLWDETIAALLRASLYYDPAQGSFAAYAHTAVHRACYRYVCRHAEKQPLLLVIAPPAADTFPDAAGPIGTVRHGDEWLRHGIHADDVDLDAELAWHSAEEEVMAREAVALKIAQEPRSAPRRRGGIP